MRRWRHLFIALTATLLAAAGAQAQNVQNFKPAAGSWNYFSVEGARVAKHGEFVPMLLVNYGNQPLTTRKGGEIDEVIIENLTTANFMLTVGLGDHFELTVDAPLHIADGPGFPVAAGQAQGSVSGFVMGDLRFTPKVRIVGLDDDYGFGVAIAMPVDVPTGDKDKFVGEDQFVINPKLILEGRVPGFSFSANGGVRFRPQQTTEVGTLELGNEVTYGAGIGIDLGTKNAVLLTEVYGVQAISNIESGSNTNPLEALAGFRFWVPGGLVITAAGGAGIVADYGSPKYRAMFGLGYHDRNYDRDKDGIMDDVDGPNGSCKDQPEDKDDFEDSDGCPDPDNDKDGILDGSDNCPNDPEDKDGFQDADGCPDPDNDGDGILDVNDSCPDQPETMNNWKDTDGCPDEIPDTDKDGIKDPVDKCPTDPEDKDGFEDANGCPDLDNDGDGIPDLKDGPLDASGFGSCRDQAEVVNGFQDEDGCPDAKPIKLKLVKVTREKIEILQKVFFKTNKATIKKRSYAVLNEVALVLKSFDYIKMIEVQGHTDSRGREKYNKKLSQKRANAVRDYLMGRGVEPERLEATGYGEEQPIETNKTREGRASNRRVEFLIRQQ